MTRQELQSLLTSARIEQQKQGIEYLVALLCSDDRPVRLRGFALLREQLEEALYQSCLNYRGLVRGFTHPLEMVMEQAIERWAAVLKGHQERGTAEDDRIPGSGVDRTDTYRTAEAPAIAMPASYEANRASVPAIAQTPASIRPSCSVARSRLLPSARTRRSSLRPAEAKSSSDVISLLSQFELSQFERCRLRF